MTHAFDGRAGGAISLSSRPDGPRAVLLRFSDNGTGIKRELLPRIFEPFYTTKMGQGGTGLGLYIVYGIVTQILGGTVRVESRPGQGTDFLLSLPLVAPNQDRRSAVRPALARPDSVIGDALPSG
jgi:signal transduction histidine kinase